MIFHDGKFEVNLSEFAPAILTLLMEQVNAGHEISVSLWKKLISQWGDSAEIQYEGDTAYLQMNGRGDVDMRLLTAKEIQLVLKLAEIATTKSTN